MQKEEGKEEEKKENERRRNKERPSKEHYKIGHLLTRKLSVFHLNLVITNGRLTKKWPLGHSCRKKNYDALPSVILISDDISNGIF